MAETTIDLVNSAKQKTGMSERALSVALGLKPSGLGMAKRRDHINPNNATKLAKMAGEEPARWALIAVAETEEDPAIKKRLTQIAESLKS